MTDKLKNIIWVICPVCLESYPEHHIAEHNGICGNCDVKKEKATVGNTEILRKETKIKEIKRADWGNE